MTTISQKIQAQLDADLKLNAQKIATLREALEEAHEAVVNCILAHTLASDKVDAVTQKEKDIDHRLKSQLALHETLKQAAMQALQQHLFERAQAQGLPSSMADSIYAMAHKASTSFTALETTFDEAARLVMIAYHAGPMAITKPVKHGTESTSDNRS